jgi:hypothetical protein
MITGLIVPVLTVMLVNRYRQKARMAGMANNE